MGIHIIKGKKAKNQHDTGNGGKAHEGVYPSDGLFSTGAGGNAGNYGVDLRFCGFGRVQAGTPRFQFAEFIYPAVNMLRVNKP